MTLSMESSKQTRRVSDRLTEGIRRLFFQPKIGEKKVSDMSGNESSATHSMKR